MLKKRHNTVKVFIAMLAVLLCFIGAVITINAKLGFSQETIIGVSALTAVAMTWAAFSITVGREATVIIQPTNYPPENVNSLRAGYLSDGEVNVRDLSSAFYYLAIKGYMDIVEYEPREFSFVAKVEPTEEDEDIKMLYKAIFGDAGIGDSVKLINAKDRLIKAIPRIQEYVIKSISKKKNREIADLSGKVLGFKQALIETKGEKLEYIVQRNDNYFYDVLPYAYAFSITSKLSSNFGHLDVKMPEWYKAYGISDDYKFDVVMYNAMLKYLPEKIKTQVVDELNDRIKIGLN